MTDIAVIREFAARAKSQLLDGVAALKCGDVTLAQLHFSLSLITQRKLLGLLEDEGAPPQKPAPAKPMRRLALVGGELPEWMTKKHNGSDPDAA